MRRQRQPQVSKAELERVLAVLKAAGEAVGSIEITPGRIVVTTVSGLSHPLDEEAELDRELEEHRRKHGYT